jgi:hypothetical protein
VTLGVPLGEGERTLVENGNVLVEREGGRRALACELQRNDDPKCASDAEDQPPPETAGWCWSTSREVVGWSCAGRGGGTVRLISETSARPGSSLSRICDR